MRFLPWLYLFVGVLNWACAVLWAWQSRLDLTILYAGIGAVWMIGALIVEKASS